MSEAAGKLLEALKVVADQTTAVLSDIHAAELRAVQLAADNASLQLKVAKLEEAAAALPRLIHVSSSTGDDAGDGSAERPLKTLAAGYARVRDGSPDRLLLKRGDTWEESLRWNKSGRVGDPIVITGYGDAPLRPRISTAGHAFNLDQGDVHDVTWQGLRLEAKPHGQRDNGAYGIRVVVGGSNLTVDDCFVIGYRENLAFAPPTQTDPGKQRTLVNVVVRRSVILDAWSTGGGTTGQGLYCDNVDGLLLQGNIFDHNGWSETVPGAGRNIYRHNVYQSERCRRVVVRGNVFARGASHGIQMRGGGLLEENLFLDNAIAAVVCGADSTVRRNVFVGGTDIGEKFIRGRGLNIESSLCLAEDNLFIHKTGAEGVRSEAAIVLQAGDHTPPGGVSAVLKGNIVCDWYGNGIDCLDGVVALATTDNVLAVRGEPRKVVTLKAVPARLQSAANKYWNGDAKRDAWFRVAGKVVPFDAIAAAGGDTTSTIADVRFPDAARTVPPDFLELARGGRADVAGLLKFIREGFARSDPQ